MRALRTGSAAYCFSSLPCLIIDGIFVIASFIVSMSGSFTSTSIVIFKRPFFSSAIKPPPYAFKPVREQVIESVNRLLWTQVQVYLRFVMELGKSLGSDFVIEN
jgi:hypothetical protein